MLVFPVLWSERLKLRQLTVDDFPQLTQLANNKKISDWIINMPFPYGEFNAVHRMSHVVNGFNNKSHFVFTIATKADDLLIGEISINIRECESAEIGYWLGEPYWGQGYMSESIAKIVDFGFERLNLTSIYATVDKNNPNSIHVLVKQGFKQIKDKGKVKVYAKFKE